MRVEAENLQVAFQKAADKLNCSVTEIDFQIIQHPSSGFLGLFKKPAIVKASMEGTKRSKTEHKTKENIKKDSSLKTHKKTTNEKTKRVKTQKTKIEDALIEIEKGVMALLKSSCFNMDEIIVKAFDEDTVLVELNGEDAALLIGKEGYRYKAFSYLLYNWINIKYGYGIRLEIAKFLTNQENMMEKYLTPLMDRIEANGKGQTKPLDGVLIKIALEALRERFPEKYVGIKTGREGIKYIVVNEFSRK